MELVYLWIGKDKVIENEGFNFSPRFRCKYENGVLDVEFLGNARTSFFSKNIDITAVVGENGSGKSSLVQHLLFHHTSSDFEYADNKYEYKMWVSDGVSESVWEVSFQEYISNKNIILYHEDIDSTLYRNQYNSNQIIANIIGTEDRYIIHNIAISSYVHITKAHIFKDINFIPTHLELKFINTIDLNHLIGYRYEEDDDWNDTIRHHQINESNINNLSQFFEKEIVKTIDKYKGTGNLKDYLYIREYLYKVANRDTKSINIIIDLINDNYTKTDLVQTLEKELFNADTEKVFREIADAVNNFKFKNYKNMEVKLTDDLESFLLNVHRGFFNISFFRKDGDVKIYLSDLSSGEQKFINIFANIFYIARTKYKDSDKDYLLILDEPDTYLHPSWQKKIISYLISFFEKTSIFKNNKIEILITSHSPFILSDIPKHHVVFLKKGKQILALDRKDTFGSNIHTLLSDGFFMDNGLIGEFAKNKIEDIINFLTNKQTRMVSHEEVESIISIIGEPVLKMRLEKMLGDYKFKKNIDTDDEIRRQIEVLQSRLLEKQDG